MRRAHKHLSILSLLLVLAGGLGWQFGPIQSVQAVISLSAPQKLATLGERGANSRLNKLVYWLDQSEHRGLSATRTINLAQWFNGTDERRAALVKLSLLENLKIARYLGLLTPENLDHLRHGGAAQVTRGPYAGESVEIDHIVPISLAPEIGNELANLEMLPRTLNRQKSNRVGARQLAYADKFYEAGMLPKTSWERVHAHARNDQ
jgi:hypothetical protein